MRSHIQSGECCLLFQVSWKKNIPFTDDANSHYVLEKEPSISNFTEAFYKLHSGICIKVAQSELNFLPFPIQRNSYFFRILITRVQQVAVPIDFFFSFTSTATLRLVSHFLRIINSLLVVLSHCIQYFLTSIHSSQSCHVIFNLGF